MTNSASRAWTRLDLPIPAGLRYGQALFVFLCWLAEAGRSKKTLTCFADYPSEGNPTTQLTHFHLTDPFNIPDDQFERLWAEWLEEKFPDLSSEF